MYDSLFLEELFDLNVSEHIQLLLSVLLLNLVEILMIEHYIKNKNISFIL